MQKSSCDSYLHNRMQLDGRDGRMKHYQSVKKVEDVRILGRNTNTTVQLQVCVYM